MDDTPLPKKRKAASALTDLPGGTVIPTTGNQFAALRALKRVRRTGTLALGTPRLPALAATSSSAVTDPLPDIEDEIATTAPGASKSNSVSNDDGKGDRGASFRPMNGQRSPHRQYVELDRALYV